MKLKTIKKIDINKYFIFITTLNLIFFFYLQRFYSNLNMIYIFTFILILFILLLNIKISYLLLLTLIPYSFELFLSRKLALEFPTDLMIIIFFIKLLFCFMDKKKIKLINIEFLKIILFTLILVMFFSIFLSSNHLLISFKAFLRFIAYLVFGFLVPLIIFKENKSYMIIIITLIVPAIILGIYGLINLIVNNFQIIGISEPFFKERGSYTAYLSFSYGIVFSLINYFDNISYKIKVGLVAILLLFGSVILVSETRGAWLGILGLHLYSFIYSKKKLRQFFLISLIVIILLSTIFLFDIDNNIYNRMDSFSKLRQGNSNIERLNRWVVALKMFENNPFLGVGYSTYQLEYFDYYEEGNFTTIESEKYMGAHSEYLTFLSELGLFGLLSLIFVYLYPIYFILRKQYSSCFEKRQLIVPISLITYLIHGLVNNYFSKDKISIIFWVIFSFMFLIRDSFERYN